MKQKKFGRKIINWHRPLRAEQRGQRYLNRWLEYPNLLDQEFSDEDIETDECWDPYDPCCKCGDYYGSCYHDHAFDYSVWSLEEFIRGILSSPTLLNPDKVPSKKALHSNKAGLLPRIEEDRGQLEARLSEFFGNVSSFLGAPKVIQSQLELSLADAHDRNVLRLAAEQISEPQLAIQVGLFSPFWIRSPRSWNQDTNFLEHVFVRYPVPKFLYSEWTRGYDIPFKWIIWFLLLGQGGSLKQASENFGWCIPAKFSKYLSEIPSDFSAVAACMMAEIRRLGGNDIDFSRIHGNIAYVVDPTEPSEDTAFLKFWQDTVRWLITNREAISNEEAYHILHWAMHEYTETRRAKGERFSWKGRRVHSVLERSLQYRRETERPWQNYQWSSHGWDWELDDPSLGLWTAKELTSGEVLFHEGRAQNHCVASYVGRCSAGHSAIVSLQQDSKRRLTVEINPSTGQVVQARGPFNRKANATEQQVLSQWVQTILRQKAASQEKLIMRQG